MLTEQVSNSRELSLVSIDCLEAFETLKYSLYFNFLPD